MTDNFIANIFKKSQTPTLSQRIETLECDLKTAQEILIDFGVHESETRFVFEKFKKEINEEFKKEVSKKISVLSEKLDLLKDFVRDELKTDYKYKNKYCVVVGNGENLSEMKILPEVYTSESEAWKSLRDKHEKFTTMWVLKIQLAGERK